MTRSKLGLGALVLGGVLIAGGPARADTITLKNGREVFGKIVEEKKDYIILRVLGREGGTIKILKRDIATFTEDDRIDYGGKVRAALPNEAGAEGGDKGSGDKGTTAAPGELSKEERDAINKLKAELKEKQAKLGLPADERVKAAELSPEEREVLEAKIGVMKSNKGSRNWQRQEVVREITAMGPKAVKPLVDLLSDKTTVKTQAARGLADLATKPDEKWLMFKHEAPQKLLFVLEDTGDEFSGRAREQANAALQAITGRSVNWAVSEGEFRTEAETKATAEWRKIVTEATNLWGIEEKKGEEERKKIAERLKLLDGPNWRDAFLEEEAKDGEKK